MGGFDLIHKGIPINPSPNRMYTTNLGCDIPSEHIARSSEPSVGSATNGGTPKAEEVKKKKSGIGARPAFGAGGGDSRRSSTRGGGGGGP